MTLIARVQADGFEPRQVSGLDAGWAGSAWIVHDDQGAYFEITLA